MINYHPVHEEVAADMIRVGKEYRKTNLADFLTQVMAGQKRWYLCHHISCWGLDMSIGSLGYRKFGICVQFWHQGLICNLLQYIHTSWGQYILAGKNISFDLISCICYNILPNRGDWVNMDVRGYCTPRFM